MALEVTTKYGTVSGIYEKGCEVFLGIPFAKPPLGDLSFRHPVEPEPWEGVYKADHALCNPVQSHHGLGVGNNSQDCLYLNIYKPENASGPLPVMVWIYGGAYAEGGSGLEQPDGDFICYEGYTYAKETKTILVTFNYRVNLYGFLNLHALSDRFDSHCGFFDQIRALSFVRENIAAFGGDEKNVTVFGQSAGAGSILALMSMPEADGLFDKAIVQSAPGDFFYNKKESLLYTKAYLRLLGVGASHPEKVLEVPEKRVERANHLFAAWVMAHMGDIRCAFSPTIDGVTLTDYPKKACLRKKIPLLIGVTSEEGTLFMHPVPALFQPFAAWWCNVFVDKGKESFYKRLCDKLTDQIFAGPSREIAKNWQGPVWQYVYDYVNPTHEKTGLGCSHASELSVLFGSDLLLEGMPADESHEMGLKMRKIWSEFAYQSTCPWPEGETYRICEE